MSAERKRSEINETHRKIQWEPVLGQEDIDFREECIRRLCLHSTNSRWTLSTQKGRETDQENAKDGGLPKRQYLVDVLKIIVPDESLRLRALDQAREWEKVNLVSCLHGERSLIALVRHYDVPQPTAVPFEAIIFEANLEEQ